MAAVSAKSEMPVFSYAQAAKGLSSAQPSAKTSSVEQTKAASTTDEPDPAASREAKPEVLPSETEAPRGAEKTAVSVDRESESASQNPNMKSTVSGSYSPSVGTSSTIKDDDSSSLPNGTSESTWDKQSQASGTEKPASRTEDAKEKTGSVAEKNAPPKELKAAPIPAVNIWKQRKEAQDAKVKALAALKPAASASKTPRTAPSAASPSGDAQQDQSKLASKKKGADVEGGNAGSKDRKKTDGGKGRDDVLAIPPVADASLWPTPQVAQGEEKRKAQEKTEKTEKPDKSPIIRPHGKEKWTPVHYVPSAVFNTPLPSAARRGPRATRGGRDGGRGGAHGTGAAGDKTASGQIAQGSTTKHAPSADRGRNEPNGVRANTVTGQSRRSNSADAASQSESRKVSQAADRGRGEARAKGNEDTNAGAVGRHLNGGEAFSRHHKPFPRNHDSTAQKGADHGKGNSHLSGDSPRTGLSQERRLGNNSQSADFQNRDYSQADTHGKDFHKDRDHPRERGEPRSERGRGGHRGRGSHSTYPVHHNSQFSNTHMSHQSFVPQKQYGFSDRRSHYGPSNSTQRSHGLSLRSPSVPTTPAAVYGVYPFPPDVNAMYGYPFMPAAPMSAVPYQQYMEPFSLMSMISMQLEYYFSVDNLCKDLFLRKHMDSQGFVALSFVAGFKRMKSLTEDFELLRHVSRQLRNVEHLVGGDGIDRLRPRERWEQWVLPLEQRDPSAQNEGPPPPTKLDENVVPLNQIDGESAAYAGANGSVSHVPSKSQSNGTSGSRASGSPLSSTAPEFLPSKPVPSQNEDENARQFQPASTTQPLLFTPFSSNRFIDVLNTAGGLAVSSEKPILCPTRMSVCSRSFDVREQCRSSNDSKMADGAAETGCHIPISWLQDRDIPHETLQPDFVHEYYNDFRKRALAKRYLTLIQDGDCDMEVLYQFWSHFLVSNFNEQMYNEFRCLALDDLSARNAYNGFNRLIEFYGSSLCGDRLISGEATQDLVDLVRKQSSNHGRGLALRTLRSAWRDGSLSRKNRERIDNVLDAGLRAELEK